MVSTSKIFEIYSAYVYFDDEQNGKRRPVIKINENDADNFAIITSSLLRETGDIKIQQWGNAGLTIMDSYYATMLKPYINKAYWIA